MKNVLFLFVLSCLLGSSAMAQCTPDPQFTSPGIFPDSATGFASGCVGIPYEQLVTAVVPEDTTVFVGPFPVTLTFDSVVVASVTGLPAGFTFACNDAQNVNSPVDGCAFEGNTIGCLLISGTPTIADTGTHLLNFTLDAYLAGGTTPSFTYDLSFYKIVIGNCGLSLSENKGSQFSLYPNPVADQFTLEGLSGLKISEISICNAEGKILKSYEPVISSSSFALNVENLKAGMYFVHIAHDSATDVIRFIKE